MITDEDVLEHLEHFGIKGMHWGVRKAVTGPTAQNIAKKAVSSRSARVGQKIGKVAREHKKAIKRVALGSGVAAATLGAAYVSHVLSRRNMVSVSAANKFANDKAGRVLVDQGSKFVRNMGERQVLFERAGDLLAGRGPWAFFKIDQGFG